MLYFRSNHRFNLISQMNYLQISIGTVILALGMIGSAQASLAPIEGRLNFVGAAVIDREAGMYASIGYLFDPLVVIATGDFSAPILAGGGGINFLDPVNVDPLNFSTLTLPETIWSISIFSFSLESLSINDGTTIGGIGTISAAGFADTEGFWSLTSPGNGDGMFSIASTAETIPSAVPVPASVWLFGAALVGLVGFSKRGNETL